VALIRCTDCSKEISDKASSCPNCGAPVDAANAIPAPDRLGFEDGEFVGTSAQLVELAKKAIGRLNYRVDSADASSGTVSFTTGVTMGSWSGVSGTVSWEETSPYHFKVVGHGKQNVKGGQVVAINLFDEANGKTKNVIDEMQRLACGGSENDPPASSCLVLLFVISGFALGGGVLASKLVS
jgi:hypothetical protein